uniref:Uncharacterized protein n=1 Tax=Cannabis sativa TaxID=3483 RepID=A0A803QSK0_CANSA
MSRSLIEAGLTLVFLPLGPIKGTFGGAHLPHAGDSFRPSRYAKVEGGKQGVEGVLGGQKATSLSIDVFALAHSAKQHAARVRPRDIASTFLFVLRVATEAGMLVTELEQVKAANRDLRAFNETLWGELTNA